eukprot:CAMPEP_0206333588 /NCGR_PEP_ID=MMETSP0106_2-20121207/25354_1 /ASSEMBLY_ACC=CAM_ASM_000206 /TAXON_ID=81532 /ORGANISM="Acanthoeca-like sp., Strain 10tr" /LENGTH=80 /DNA_ID=CAMNT_0053766467 /DNA_START=366 /DNA_END=608 /DNA_ORIENTATION=-
MKTSSRQSAWYALGPAGAIASICATVCDGTPAVVGSIMSGAIEWPSIPDGLATPVDANVVVIVLPLVNKEIELAELEPMV